MNGLIESDAKAAQTARRYGWKISKYQNPTEEPYFDLIANQWFLLGDDYTKGALQVQSKIRSGPESKTSDPQTDK